MIHCIHDTRCIVCFHSVLTEFHIIKMCKRSETKETKGPRIEYTAESVPIYFHRGAGDIVSHLLHVMIHSHAYARIQRQSY